MNILIWICRQGVWLMAVVLVFILIMMVTIGLGRQVVPKMDAKQRKINASADSKSENIGKTDTKSTDSKSGNIKGTDAKSDSKSEQTDKK